MLVGRHLVDALVKCFEADGRPVVHLFAGPYVTFAGSRKEVPEGSKRLLAFVALRRRRVDRRQAAGALWPVGDDCRAAGNLRTALWRLRGAGIDVVAADKWSLSLIENIAVDTHIVSEWANRVINEKPFNGDLTLTTDPLEDLDLFPGWYDDWAIMERERMRQRMLHALEALSRQLTRLHRYADAVEVALTAISADPLRESAQRALIDAYASEGNQVEACRVYLAYVRLLRRELGVEPSRDLALPCRLDGSSAEQMTSLTVSVGEIRNLERVEAM
jgi:DNA-binding SARP family transcriptional activator